MHDATQERIRDSAGAEPVTVIETERLRLRTLCSPDAPFIRRLLNEPSFRRNIGDRGVRTLDDARAYIRNGPMASYQARGFGLWLVELRDSRAPIGICGLLKRDALEDVDLGYALVPEHWSRGYALEAATASLTFARTEFGLRRILAITNAGNQPSIRLLERMGFRFERMMRLPGEAHELKLFASDVP